MAHVRTVLEARAAGTRQPSLLRLTVVALLLALAFDALSTALAWDVVEALQGGAQRSAVHAVRPAELRETTRRPDAPPGGQPTR